MELCYNRKGPDNTLAKVISAALTTQRGAFRESQLQELTMPINRRKIRRVISINGVQVWVTANSEQEYADKIIQLAGGSNRQSEGSKYTFKEYAERWYENFSKPNVANVTALSYRKQLDLHIFPVIGNKKLNMIKPADIQKIYNEMGKTSKETKNKVKIVLNQVFKLAVDEELISNNPVNSSSIKLNGTAPKETKPYTVEQMRYLAAHVKDLKDNNARAWLALAVSLPLRPEEILGLKWEDVDLTNNIINVNGTVTHPDRNKPEYKPYTKTVSSVRTLAMPALVVDVLKDGGDKDSFVVGGKEPLSYTVLRKMLKKIEKDISFCEKITPRRFRTTVATDISSETKDLKLVQKMLGHSTPEMTLRHYDKGRNNAGDAAKAIEKCYRMTCD